MEYHRLTQEERYQIYALAKAGMSIRGIAKTLERDPSTISREIRRNRGQRGYRPRQAHMLATQRVQAKIKRSHMTPEQEHYLQAKLALKWSPEQISGRMKLEGIESVSHETIYRYVLKDKKNGGTLYKHLRHQRKRYKKRYGSHDRRGEIPNKVSIDERPSEVDSKERIGDFEIDLVIGKNHKQALVTAVDRHSMFTIINKVSHKRASLVKDALVEMLLPLKRWLHTLTSDNGKEFAAHEFIAKTLGVNYYFCHPYASWERGLNENTNGLLRQFFPKGSDFTQITQVEITQVQNSLNHRPRKSLEYKTPAEVFYGTIVQEVG